jgi:hypothetical protein
MISGQELRSTDVATSGFLQLESGRIHPEAALDPTGQVGRRTPIQPAAAHGFLFESPGSNEAYYM